MQSQSSVVPERSRSRCRITARADPVPPPPAPATPAAPAPANPPAPAPANPPAAPDAAPGPAGPAAAPPAADPVAPPPAFDPNAPAPPPVDPNAGRIDNPVGATSFVLPAGWVESDATHLDYGAALLARSPGPPAGVSRHRSPTTPASCSASWTRSSTPALNPSTKAATRLASDMGEFFMPYPGTRINQETTALSAKGMSGGASFYEVKFSDASKPNGQIWAGVVGPSGPNVPPAVANQRWFVVWLGTGNDPVDKAGAQTLAESVLPLLAPPAAPAPAPARRLGTRSGCTRSGVHRLRLPRRELRLLRRRRHRHPDSPPPGTARHRLRARSLPSFRLDKGCSGTCPTTRSRDYPELIRATVQQRALR